MGAVPGAALDAPQLLDVDVQQLAGPLALIHQSPPLRPLGSAVRLTTRTRSKSAITVAAGPGSCFPFARAPRPTRPFTVAVDESEKWLEPGRRHERRCSFREEAVAARLRRVDKRGAPTPELGAALAVTERQAWAKGSCPSMSSELGSPPPQQRFAVAASQVIA